MIKDSEEEMSSCSAFRLFGTTISLPADDVISVQNGCCLQSQDATTKLFNPDSSIISVQNECCRKRSATDLQTQGSNSQEKSAKVLSPESKAESLIKYPVKRIKSQESDPGKSSANVLEEHNPRLGSEKALRLSRSSSSCTQSFINDPIKRFKCQESEEQLNPRNALFLSCSSSSHKTASNGDPETEFSASKSEESSTNEDAFAESLQDDDENSFEISENAFLLTKSLLTLKNAKSEDLETEISKRGFADLQIGKKSSGMEKSSAILLNPEEIEGDNSKTCLSSESSESALRFSRSLPFLQKGQETAISSAKGASAYLQRCEKKSEMEKSSAILSKKEENEEENSRKCLSSENSENALRFRRSLPFLQASKNEGHKTATSSAKAAVPYPRRGEAEKSSANGGENLKESENALRFGRSLPFSAVNCVTETSSPLCLQKSSKTEKSSPNGEKIFAQKGEENARASLGFGNALRFTGSMPFLRLPKKETEISAENTSRYAKSSDENDKETETGHAKAAKSEKPAMQCPRCSSVETKFCYYNNYNVNQPRYFCKNCRRYWTAGGTMRNIPIGAGRRKNKQHQLFQSKAPPIHPKESSAVDSPGMNNAAVEARRASSCHVVSSKQGAVSYGCSPWTFAAQNPRTAYLSTFYGVPPPLLQKHSRP